MPNIKKAESCSCGNKGGSYCDGNYGEPKGHLDTQIFPCKKDPSKKKKKKKAGVFNLMQYRQASNSFQEIQSNPELLKNPPALQEALKLVKSNPELSAIEIIQIVRNKKLLPTTQQQFPSQKNTLPGNV